MQLIFLKLKGTNQNFAIVDQAGYIKSNLEFLSVITTYVWYVENYVINY